MISKELLSVISESISKPEDSKFKIDSYSSVGGGSINQAYELKSQNTKYFLKLNSAKDYPLMFQREAEGLEVLADTKAIRIPKTFEFGTYKNDSWLLMEFIESDAYGKNFWDDFGRRLANLHGLKKTKFGFKNDNYIGSLPQLNTKFDTWSEFFIEARLQPLVRKSRDGGLLDSSQVNAFERLFLKLEHFFPNEPASLLHGDLWSGNFMSDSEGNPVIFDPAVYYGHREMDIGMTKLFGGFDKQFYEAYNDAFPMERGWEQRIDVANLYPLLVHVILFGGSYLHDVKSILKRFT